MCVEKNSCASIRVFTRETRVRNAALVVDFITVYVFACISDEAPYCAATYKRVRELSNIASLSHAIAIQLHVLITTRKKLFLLILLIF